MFLQEPFRALSRIPTKAKYLTSMSVLTAASDRIYQYLNFDKIEQYADKAKSVMA